MHNLIQILNILSPGERKRSYSVIFTVIAMAIMETTGVLSVMPFLAVLGNPQLVDTNHVLNSLYEIAKTYLYAHDIDDFLIILGGFSFAMIIVSALYRAFTEYKLNRFVERCRFTLGSSLLKSYLMKPYDYFLTRHSADMSKKILSEADQLISDVFRPIIMMLVQIVVVIGLVSILVISNPILAVTVASAFGILYGGVYVVIRRILLRVGKERSQANKERFLAVGDAFSCIKSIKLLGCEWIYLERYNKSAKTYARMHSTKQLLSQLPNYIIEALIFGGIILLTLIMLINQGGVNGESLGKVLPVLGLYAFSAYRIKPAAKIIFTGLTSLRYGSVALDSLTKDLTSMTHQENISEMKRISPLPVHNEIILRGIDFMYPDTRQPTLVGVDLVIPAGSSVGIVGSTGSGKTTLVDIVLGLLKPTGGSILVDDQPVTGSNLRQWQKNLGYVPQEIILTDASVAENIALGIPRDQIDHEQVIRCARIAHIHDFISEELPNQYSTTVGERGIRFSGGQRQRIGIARALYHDPEVLIFDEATSALDSLTESSVMLAIDEICNRKKTVIIIAHRINTLRNCNKIILLENGQIKSEGSYSDYIESIDYSDSMART